MYTCKEKQSKSSKKNKNTTTAQIISLNKVRDNEKTLAAKRRTSAAAKNLNW